MHALATLVRWVLMVRWADALETHRLDKCVKRVTKFEPFMGTTRVP
jgi:hypothetical protein